MRKDFRLVDSVLNEILQNNSRSSRLRDQDEAKDLITYQEFTALLWEVEERQNRQTLQYAHSWHGVDSAFNDILN